ncbi:MAG: M60 family peptidase N-terminal accessory domain-containing protein [Verrucomicrobiales bacterium]|nr:M60 family peptidase N-terminal accessory domain-containing protein [Verrucomicrobiales bacterium]
MKFIVTIFLISFSSAHAAGFEDLLEQLSDHLSNREQLSAAELSSLESAIINQAPALAKDIRLVTKAFDVIATYDKSNQPLFLNKKTSGGFSRKDRSGKELEHVIFQLQQAILDQAYHVGQIKDHYRELNSRFFACADYFPGKVSRPKDPRKVYQRKIDASQIPPSGSPLTTDDSPARRCTGWYVAPGSIAELKVPSALVNKGYAIRVGAHSWDLKKKPVIKRLDRISIVYPIEQDRILIAHPLGGGIYLEVPPEADAGICDLYARNIVEAPFYSARSFHKTTLQEWKTERSKPAPWADFESDKFMMQVPTSWIARYNTPDTLTEDYDKCMDLVSEITGRSKIRSKVVLYHQIDVIMRGSAFFPGYPHSNTNWNPLGQENGNKDHWFLQGPQFARHELFHEMGHMERITKFKGETEALVNFLYLCS